MLLKDDDGRVYKTPGAHKKQCMPKTFKGEGLRILSNLIYHIGPQS